MGRFAQAALRGTVGPAQTVTGLPPGIAPIVEWNDPSNSLDGLFITNECVPRDTGGTYTLYTGPGSAGPWGLHSSSAVGDDDIYFGGLTIEGGSWIRLRETFNASILSGGFADVIMIYPGE